MAYPFLGTEGIHNQLAARLAQTLKGELASIGTLEILTQEPQKTYCLYQGWLDEQGLPQPSYDPDEERLSFIIHPQDYPGEGIDEKLAQLVSSVHNALRTYNLQTAVVAGYFETPEEPETCLCKSEDKPLVVTCCDYNWNKAHDLAQDYLYAMDGYLQMARELSSIMAFELLESGRTRPALF